MKLLNLIPGMTLIKGVFKYSEFIIITGLILALAFQSTRVSELKSNVAIEIAESRLLKMANDINLNTIETLRNWQFQQTQAYIDLEKKVGDIQVAANVLRLDIAELGRNDEETRDYLNTPIPVSVRGLLQNPTQIGESYQIRGAGILVDPGDAP